MSSIFSRIIQGEIPCHKILEDAKFLAFLDIRPIRPGHTLVIPKKEIDYLFDMDNETLAEMMVFAKRVAGYIRRAVECQRIGVMVAGLEVPHAHIHLVPIVEILDLNFAKAKPANPQELSQMAERIRGYVQ